MPYGLKFLTGPHTGRILNVSKDMFAIGRDETCQIRIGHHNISRRHCELKFVNGVLVVEDLGSSNGTYLNGVRITEPERVRSGDQLQIGGLKLEVDMLVENFDHVLDRQRLTPEIAASSTHIYSPEEMVNLSRPRSATAPPPEQKTEGFYRLQMLSGEHQGKILRVSKAEFLIGREEVCDLRPACDQVSRQHCKILMQGGKLLICDLGTPNGTRVNQKTILSTQMLKLGDRVHIGSFSFAVHELPSGTSSAQAPANEDDIVNWLNEVEDEAEAAAATRIQSTADMKDFYQKLGIEPPKRLQGSAATSARATLDESTRKKTSSADSVQKLARHLKLSIEEYRLQNGAISIADIHKALTEVFESIK